MLIPAFLRTILNLLNRYFIICLSFEPKFGHNFGTRTPIRVRIPGISIESMHISILLFQLSGITGDKNKSRQISTQYYLRRVFIKKYNLSIYQNVENFLLYKNVILKYCLNIC